MEDESAVLARAKLRLNTCKIIVAGDGRAGKTSLLRNLRREPFDPEEESTRGVAACTVDVREESWDDAGGGRAMSYESKLAQVYRRDQQPEGKAEPEPAPDSSASKPEGRAAPQKKAAAPKVVEMDDDARIPPLEVEISIIKNSEFENMLF